MTGDATDSSLLEQLAESFVGRFRRGEHPSISEYVQRYPDLATQIEETFPALAMMEQVYQDLGSVSVANTSASGPPLVSIGDFRIVREVGRGGMGRA